MSGRKLQLGRRFRVAQGGCSEAGIAQNSACERRGNGENWRREVWIAKEESAAMKISDVLGAKGPRVVTTWPSKHVSHVLRVFDERNIASIVVTDGSGLPLGMVTDRLVLRALSRHGAEALDMTAADVMLAPAPSCTMETTISDALRFMTDERVRHLVVLEDRRMAGLVSIGDLVKARLQDAEMEGRVLREMALGHLAAE